MQKFIYRYVCLKNIYLYTYVTPMWICTKRTWTGKECLERFVRNKYIFIRLYLIAKFIFITGLSTELLPLQHFCIFQPWTKNPLNNMHFSIFSIWVSIFRNFQCSAIKNFTRFAKRILILYSFVYTSNMFFKEATKEKALSIF